MKIAISSTTEKIDSQIDETFGRCPYFIIADIKDGKVTETKNIKNETTNQTSGAGIATAQLMAKEKVEAVITGNMGPRALDVLGQFKIKVYSASGDIKQAIKDLADGKLEEIK